MTLASSYDAGLEASARKAIGAFYTPADIVHVMLDRALMPRLRAARTVEAVLALSVYDPSCGDGRFLVEAGRRIVARLVELGERPGRAAATRVEQACLHGADLDPGAIALARARMPCASLAVRDPLAGPAVRRFEVVVGNPPYGLRSAAGGDSARAFIAHALDVLADWGTHSFIVPKALVYSATWRSTLARLMPGLAELIDCGKAWREVKLEQVVYVYENSPPSGLREDYCSGVLERGSVRPLGLLDKASACEFGFALNGVSAAELELGRRIRAAGSSLGTLSTNSRGAGLQPFLSDKGTRLVLGGRDLARFRVRPERRRYLASGHEADPRAGIPHGTILAQNIVAHVTRPVPHLKITAALPPRAPAALALDTVNKICWKGPYSREAAVAILNSSLVSWYVYRFIVARAIRTIHFDAPVTDRIPFPATLCRGLDAELTGLARELAVRPSAAADAEIDRLVSGLYGLGKREARAVRV